MIYLPWIVFGLSIAYMIYQAKESRNAFLRSKKELEQRRDELTQQQISLHGVKYQLRGQDQKQDPAEALVGSQHGQRPN